MGTRLHVTRHFPCLPDYRRVACGLGALRPERAGRGFRGCPARTVRGADADARAKSDSTGPARGIPRELERTAWRCLRGHSLSIRDGRRGVRAAAELV